MFNQEFFHACIGLKKKIVPLKVNMYFPILEFSWYCEAKCVYFPPSWICFVGF